MKLSKESKTNRVKKQKEFGTKEKNKLKKKNGKEFISGRGLPSTTEYIPEEQKEVVKWYEKISDEMVPKPELEFKDIINLKSEAKKIYDSDVLVNNSKISQSKSSNHKWMEMVIAKGTVADKIAAYTLLIQDMPMYNLQHVENMVAMVKVGKKRECFMVIDTLVELFLESLLPPNRKLIAFIHRPLSTLEPTGTNRKQALFAWYFEDQLKEIYRSFVMALNLAAHDSVDANKEKVITAMYKLLEGNPEQESALLSNIVNKLGDPSHKIGSKVIYNLTKLLQAHPNMKTVIMEEVEKLLFRSNISKRPQYYGICFLTQFHLSKDDSDLAANLIQIYFSLFKACIKKGEVDSKMMSALLTGVNRAFPYVDENKRQFTEYIDQMYKVVHLAKFNVAVHALCLLFQADSGTDRFFSVLYKKIIDPTLSSSTHHAMFLSLVFKALKKDTNTNRIKAFIKRLLQVTIHLPVPMACGILFIISQIIKYKKQSDLLQLQLEADAFVKLDLKDDEEERYTDVKQEDDTPTVAEEIKDDKEATWHHVSHTKPIIKEKQSYNPFERNPTYAGVEFTCHSELTLLVKHFHPTVSLFAQKLLSGESILYSGDPLQDFTLARFLDRFVFKNPKKSEKDTKTKTMSLFDRKKNYELEGAKKLAVNSLQYLNQDEENIPVDERFLYTYLHLKKDSMIRKRRDSDNESVASDEFEEMMDNLVGKKRKHKAVDLADEIGQLPKKTKKDQHKSHDEDDESVDETEEEDDDDEADGGEKDDESSVEEFDGDEVDDLGSDDDLEGSDIADEDNEVLNTFFKPKNKKGEKEDLSKLFASAEEFSELLEETGASKYAGKYSTKDNAGVKQLAWEEKQDWRIKGNKKQRGNKRFQNKGNKFHQGRNNKFPTKGKGDKAQRGNNKFQNKGNK